MSRWLERVAVVVVSLAIAIGVIALLSGGLAGSQDNPGVAAGRGPAPGTGYRDQGDTHLTRGDLRPVYDSEPPTSGPHIPVAIAHDDARITDDQLLQALELGDVVIMYGGAQPPPGLQAVAAAVSPFTPTLASQGQAVILARRPGLGQITALAWTHMLRSDSGSQLRAFAQYWLGRGAGNRVRSVSGTG